MRLGTRRRICIKSKNYSRRGCSLGLIALLLTLVSFSVSLFFVKIIRPTMIALAKNEATVLAELAIHRVVGQLFENTDFREIVSVKNLDDGTVSAVESDMSRINALKAKATLAITQGIAEICETQISIPLGTLTGVDLFSGTGPHLPVSLMPYGNVVVDFKTEFSETGINQTLLSVNLTATATVGIVMPSVNTTSRITTDIPITQTVIVGKIPDNYVNIDRVGEDYEGDVLDIIG